MFDLKIKSKATFSFSKLSHKLSKIVNDVTKEGGKDLAHKLKDYIKSGKVKPALKETTIKRRNQIGYNPDYPNLRGNKASKDKPLYATGKLYESIKSKNGVVSFNAYGLSHDKGLGRPQRKWISAMTVKTEPETLKKIGEDIKNAFKLKTPVSLRNMKF